MGRPVNDTNLMINVRLMKITGLYNLLSSCGPKLYGLTVYGWTAAAEVTCMIAAIFALVTSIMFCAEDLNRSVEYTLDILACVMVTIKLYWVTRYADTVWTCVQATRMDCLSYGRKRTWTLEAGRTESKFLSTVVATIWLVAVLFWILIPFILWGQYKEVRFDDRGTRRYRMNVLNLIFPIAEESYDKYFIVYYLIESMMVIVFGHAELTFDVLVISLCTAVLYQLRTVADSFVELSAAARERSVLDECKIKSTEDDESILISNLKTSIRDQQILYNNIRNMYNAFRPVILYQIAIDSTTTVLLSSIVIMNHYNGMSMVSPINLKFAFSSLIRIVHLFLICYLFTNVNEEKNSLNFALYSSDWTAKSLQYKNLLLYAMRMNCTDNLKLKVTIKHVVNFELYGRILRITYSILSVLAKWCAKKK